MSTPNPATQPWIPLGGGPSAPYRVISDWNQAITSGFYWSPGNATNVPGTISGSAPNGIHGIVWAAEPDNTSATGVDAIRQQVWAAHDSSSGNSFQQSFERSCIYGTWNTWTWHVPLPMPVVANRFLKGSGTSWATWSALAAGDMPVNLNQSYGTTLPASPVTGQEATLVDSTTNPSYQWRFRYNGSSSSAYKWEFIGGAPWQIAPAQFNNPSANAYNSDVAAGSTLTLPRAGDYILESEAGVVTAAGLHYMGYTYDPNTRQGVTLPGGAEAVVSCNVKTTCTAAQVIANIFYSNVTGAVFPRRALSAIPVRVS
jgi:hypothetical protein